MLFFLFLLLLFLFIGSGKTFTIEGGQGDFKGIIPRAIEQIFQCNC